MLEAPLRPEWTDPYGPALPPQDTEPPPKPRLRWRLWLKRALLAGILLFFAMVAWLAVTAPLSRSLKPIAPPSITLLSAEGRPIARKGAIIAAPVDASVLPDHVTGAFLAIEDRRFRSHWGIDPRGLARAMWRNAQAGGLRQGGSTITQQLAKVAFLNSDRTAGRKLRELMIAFWLEAWLTKDQILERYLSNVYFGDNVYGLRAASLHYFNRRPEKLTVPQAAMLAGLLKAPSRLSPAVNYEGARQRGRLVIAAMVETGVITQAEANRLKPAKLDIKPVRTMPSGGYFADWVLPEARDLAGAVYAEQSVTTTLDADLQRLAERVTRGAGLGKAQIALVAMRPTGEVVAMVGGKDYKSSAFNRATQARRQPGSTFKLFVYLAALREGYDPESPVLDEPVTIGDYSPKNDGGRYRGAISLKQAFAASSNVVAVRLADRIGRDKVIEVARDLGVASPIHSEPSMALGTSGMTLLELTQSYAAVAGGRYPVKPRGLPEAEDKGWIDAFWDRKRALTHQRDMLELLSAAANQGTGRSAALRKQTYGKTGTTQDNRDAIFVGFAGDLVTAVWIGNDDNTPLAGIGGGGLPARIWRQFMAEAIDDFPAPAPREEPAIDLDLRNGQLNMELGDPGIGVVIDQDGVVITPPPIEDFPFRDEEFEEPPPPPRFEDDEGEPF